jgi:hypothetical protein
MRRILPPALFALILTLAISSTAFAGTFYIAANGSDSNNGSQTSPWAHLPGMATWTGNYRPTAGDTLILRGCDVWGNSNFPITWTWSGSNGNPITIDRSTTWYNTANCPSGWNRAVFNAGSAVMGGAECSGDNNNKFFQLNSVNFVTFNWLELTGYYWNTNAGGSCGSQTGTIVDANNSDSITLSSWFVHKWSHGPSAGDSDHFFDIVNGGTMCPNCLITGMVLENDDGSGDCGAGVQWSTTNSVIRNMVNGIKPKTQGNFGSLNISDIHHGFDSTHENIIEPVGGNGSGIYYFHDIYVHDNASGELQFGNQGETYYIWNNVNVQGANTRNWAFPQQPGNGPKALYFWNNTIVSASSGGGAGILTCNPCNPATWQTIDIENNYVITPFGGNFNGGLIECSDCGSNQPFPSSGTRTVANNLVITPTNASNQGYTDSSTYVYSPQNNNCSGISANCPIGAGVNLSSSWPSGYTYNDTTYACVQQTVSGVIESVCNQRTTVPRPGSGAWDVGAYEFSANSSAPNPPTGLNVVIQ